LSFASKDNEISEFLIHNSNSLPLKLLDEAVKYLANLDLTNPEESNLKSLTFIFQTLNNLISVDNGRFNEMLDYIATYFWIKLDIHMQTLCMDSQPSFSPPFQTRHK
jgi:hypothetical protein